MPSQLLGKWKLGKSDNFDNYMKQVGVNIALRKMALIVSSTSEITEEGENQIRINTQSTFRSSNVLFPLGKEIDEHTMDDRDVKTTVVWDGDDKLLEIQRWEEGKDKKKRETKIEWILTGDGKMILRLECEGVVCERHHERCT
ncbi:fatty acid-binding protein, heart-like [Styela clava]|uniref:fatty acid-binding protein, heart-like n=1 Tax=Styela clava TaxID=7725 RepID=UPI00193A6B82|nr:fatty acid-binding protein, heart-like [Styela clava]